MNDKQARELARALESTDPRTLQRALEAPSVNMDEAVEELDRARVITQNIMELEFSL
jgi:hypothetical protein